MAVHNREITVRKWMGFVQHSTTAVSASIMSAQREIAVVHQYTIREYLYDCSTELNGGSTGLHSIGSEYGSITELGCRSLTLVVRR